MNEETRLNQLLDVLDERREEGESVSLTDLCRHCPDLLPSLQRHQDVVAQMERFLRIGETPSSPLAPGRRGENKAPLSLGGER
jgi:hypothetical protein